MNFSEPFWLVAGLICCIALLLFFHFMKKRRTEALARFVFRQRIGTLTGNISEPKRKYKNALMLLGIFLCFAALARPQYGFHWVDIKRKGIDLLFALDTSKSMLAEDIKPNRLKRAHLAILDFVQQLEGDRVGLMPFAGSAYLMCPLTLDYETFAQSLAEISTDIIPRGGTNIAEVINRSLKTLDNSANHKILIILTDGENLEGDAIQAAEDAAKKGLTIYTVGVGTATGELIPISSGEGAGSKGFVKDASGKFVTSRLDEKTLIQIADKSGGIYAPLGSSGEGLERIYQQKLSLIPKEELAERRHKLPIERSEWPLAAALACFVLEFFIGERKNGRKLSSLVSLDSMQAIRTLQKRIRFKKIKIPGTLLIIFALSFSSSTSYASEGEKAFEQGNYLQSSDYYAKRLEKSPDDPALNYNFGAAAYKNNLFDEAIDAFNKALKSDRVELQQKAYYNRGNSQYKQGEEMLAGDPGKTVEAWKQALSSMQAAIELSPEDERARFNHGFIKNRLEELQKQMEDQQQEKPGNKDQNKQNNNDQSAQNQDQGRDRQDQKQQPEKAGENKPDSSQQTQQNAVGDDNKRTQTGPQREQQRPGDDAKKPEAINAQDEEKKAEKSAAAQAAQAAEDSQRRKEGKMTEEEARQLLNGLKNEEGELNFVPAGRSNGSPPAGKDW